MNEVYINIKEFSEDWIGKYLAKKFNKDLVSVDNLLCLIEELASDKEYLEEKIEDMQKEDYRLCQYEEYGE